MARPPARFPRLSRRTAWDRTPRPLDRALEAARAAGRALVDLTESNPTRVGIAYPWDELAAIHARAAREPYRPEPFGLASARSAVGEQYAVGLGLSRILLTASTSEAYSHLFRLLTDPGDVVLIPRPSYPLFGLLADLEGVELASYRLDPFDGWRPDWDSLDAAAHGRAVRAVVIVSPNNPTGSSLDAAALAELAHRARERGWALIADEVFCDYRDEGLSLVEAARLGILDDVTWFALGGLSKSAGLPGAKLAWTLVGEAGEASAEIRARLEVIADTFLSPSMAVQVALPEILALAPRIRVEIDARLAANRSALARLAGTAVSAPPVAGGWSAVLQVPNVRDDEAWARSLIEDAGVVVHPGSFFELDGGARLVVSLLPEPVPFVHGLREIARHAARS